MADLILDLSHPENRKTLRDVFFDFYGIGMHSASGYLVTVRNTHAVVRIRQEEPLTRPQVFYCKNQTGEHVEQVVIKALIKKLKLPPRELAGGPGGSSNTSSPPHAVSSPDPRQQPPAISVDLFLNHSPCGKKGCCQELTNFQDKYPEVKLTVIFSALYNARRHSCNRCTHGGGTKDHAVNQEGLRMLEQSPVTLRTFREYDWEFLVSVLPLERSGDQVAALARPPAEADRGGDPADAIARGVAGLDFKKN